VSGPLAHLTWVKELRTKGAQGGRATAVQHETTLFGTQIIVTTRGAGSLVIELEPDAEALHASVAAAARSSVIHGRSLREIARISLPIDADRIADAYAVDVVAIGAAAERYRQQRRRVDEIVEAAF
jgi:hypothetical protein